MGTPVPAGYRKTMKEQAEIAPSRAKRRLSSTSAAEWLHYAQSLLDGADPKNDQKDFKNPEDLTLLVEGWTEGFVTFPAGAEIYFPNQRAGINPSTGKPVRSINYVMVTVKGFEHDTVYVLTVEKVDVKFECRPQPITHRRYMASVPYPPTLA